METIRPEDAPTCEKCGGQIEHEEKLFSEVPENGLCECLEVPNWTGDFVGQNLVVSSEGFNLFDAHYKLKVQLNLAIIQILTTVHKFELPSEIAENFDVELISAIVDFRPKDNDELAMARERILRAAGVQKSAWGRWIK